MSINIDKAILMSGDDLKISPQITLHHPTIGEILSLNSGKEGEKAYWNYVSVLMSDPYTNMVMLDDMGMNFMETTPFEVFVLQWIYLNQFSSKEQSDIYKTRTIDIISALNFFTNKENKDRTYELCEYNGNRCLCDLNNPSFIIDEEVFNYLHEWLKNINNIDFSNRIKPADENARIILIEDERAELRKRKRLKKDNDNRVSYIGNLMSAVSFCGNGSITPFNIKDCKIYWLFESFNIDNKKSMASHILDGIYYGTVNQKNLNKNSLNWMI